MSSVLMTISNR